jgi:hypothetical protein
MDLSAGQVGARQVGLVEVGPGQIGTTAAPAAGARGEEWAASATAENAESRPPLVPGKLALPPGPPGAASSLPS